MPAIGIFVLFDMHCFPEAFVWKYPSGDEYPLNKYIDINHTGINDKRVGHANIAILMESNG